MVRSPPAVPGRPAAAAVELHFGTSADHHAAHAFLSETFLTPPVEEFLAQLEDPFYDPPHRLLAKDGQRIVGHVLILPRTTWLGETPVPAADLSWWAVAPAFRGQGIGARLLAKAEAAAVADGAELALLTARPSRSLMVRGWLPCRALPALWATPQQVLSALAASGIVRAARTIRPWRRVELPALMRLHRQFAGTRLGAYERNEAYWQWLIQRRALDQVLVAVQGGGRLGVADSQARIDGYAVLRGHTILEWGGSQPSVGAQLLARVCEDALETDSLRVGLHAPAGDALRAFFPPGEQLEGPRALLKVLQPRKLLMRLAPQLLHRARQAAWVPARLGLACGTARYLVRFGRRAARITEANGAKMHVRCTPAAFTRLLTGQIAQDGQSDGLQFASAAVKRLVAAIFPRWTFFRSPLDDVMGGERCQVAC